MTPEDWLMSEVKRHIATYRAESEGKPESQSWVSEWVKELESAVELWERGADQSKRGAEVATPNPRSNQAVPAPEYDR